MRSFKKTIRVNWLNILILIVIFTLIHHNSARAQISITPERITIEDGLSQGYIGALAQDSEGFIWIGTKNGLNRYDGREFEIFTHDPSDPYSITDDWTTGILEHGDYLLVIGIRGDLDIYSKRTKRFYHIPEIVTMFGGPNALPTISRDTLGQFWIFSKPQQKLIRLVIPSTLWADIDNAHQKPIDNSSILKDDIEITEINLPVVLNLGFIDEGRSALVITPDRSSHLVDIVSAQVRDDDTKSFDEEKRVNFIALSETEVLGFRSHSLSIYADETWHTVQTEFNISGVIVMPQLHQIWVRTPTGLLLISRNVLDQESINRSDAIAVLPGLASLTYQSITDRSGISYIGSAGYGIMKINPRLLDIKHFFQGESVYGIPFATDHGEIIVRNPPPHGIAYHPGTDAKFEFVAKRLASSGEGLMLHSSLGQYWLLTNERERTIRFYTIDTTHQTFTEAASFDCTSYGNFAAMADRAGNILLACESTLAMYNASTRVFDTYDMGHISQGESGYYSMTESEAGKYWIGSPIGLISAELKNDKYEFELIEVEAGVSNGLQNNHVAALLRDPTDDFILWIGTKGGGLQRLDTRTMDFTTFNTKNGLPNNVVYGVLNDEQGRIWISSNKGITRLDPSTGKTTNFVEADGLQSNEFNTFAYTKTPNGQMLFGGIYGMNMFHPNDLQINQNLASPLLTRLEINNVPISALDSTGILNQALEYTSSITLPYTRNNITLHFVSTEYTAPFENQFRYYLEGAEEPWVHVSTDSEASYLNLRPGNYTFHLMTSNNDGVWNDKSVSLHIEITPPWYQSGLAYGIYILIFLLSGWWALRIRESRIQMRHDIAMEQNEALRLKDLDRAKSQLYTNITHEFRTPLTVISGIANELKGDEEHKQLIKDNSEQLLDLVNQMLDLRKFESGAMALNMEQVDCVSFLRYVVNAFESFATSRGLTLDFSSNMEELVIDIDRHKMTRVISNLLSNAIKFTPDGGNIKVDVEHKPAEDAEQIVITVSDTGIGIPESSLAHIFDRFYQVDQSSTRAGEGTGVGLSLVREIVHMLNGQIQVSSIKGEGTVFSVQLPITREADNTDMDVRQEAIYTGAVDTNLESIGVAPVPVSPDRTRPSLLIIEDSPDVAKYLITCLEGLYELELARDGREGMEKAIASIPDIIVSDVMMPFADGFEVCNTLKTDVRTSHIPIILLTAKADIESRIEGLKRGADAYIAKPFHKQELLVELQKLIALRKLLQSRYQILEAHDPSDDPGTQLEDAFIQTFREIVESNLDDADFDVVALCKAMGSSRSQLHRKITALTGMSTSGFQRSIRLNRAKELLRESDLNVSEIAYDIGFRDPNYFTKAFSSAYGLTPTQFRKEGRS